MYGGLPGWGREVPSFAFSARERNLFPFPRSTLAVLVTVREQLGQRKCRTAVFPAWPSSTVSTPGTGGDWAQSNTKVEGAQRHDTALSLREGTGEVSSRWHGHPGDAWQGPEITFDGSWSGQWAERGCHWYPVLSSLLLGADPPRCPPWHHTLREQGSSKGIVSACVAQQGLEHP